MDLTKNQDELTAAYLEGSVMVRISGRGSFKTSLPLKQFIQHVMDDEKIDQIFIDMKNCIGMDSTFMGVITGLSVAARKRQNKHIKLINMSDKNQNLLKALGVDRVIDYSLFSDQEDSFSTSPPADQQSLSLEDQNKADLAKTSLEAHICLSKLSSENKSKFKAVVEYLQDDVDNLDA